MVCSLGARKSKSSQSEVMWGTDDTADDIQPNSCSLHPSQEHQSLEVWQRHHGPVRWENSCASSSSCREDLGIHPGASDLQVLDSSAFLAFRKHIISIEMLHFLNEEVMLIVHSSACSLFLCVQILIVIVIILIYFVLWRSVKPSNNNQ